MSEFIPLFKYDEYTEKTMYVNKNAIVAYSHFKDGEKDCLRLQLDHHKLAGNNLPPTNYILCKQDNPYAYNELFHKPNPDVVPSFVSYYIHEKAKK